MESAFGDRYLPVSQYRQVGKVRMRRVAMSVGRGGRIRLGDVGDHLIIVKRI
jgi:hypothetical protein